jgi:uncharacterized membrane protein YhhN
MKKLFLILFGVIFALDLIAEITDITLLYQVSKPLILPSLMGLYIVSSSAGERSGLLILALIFSWAGDVLLMFSGELYFMLGLGGFLISHVCYIFTYRQFKTEEGVGFHGVQKARYAFPIILAATGLLTVLYPSLGGMKVPVTVYAFVLMAMTLAALFRFGYTQPQSFWLVFVGGVLFLISDSTLAINKFLTPLPNDGLIVMGTYMSAQFLIVWGLLRHKG